MGGVGGRQRGPMAAAGRPAVLPGRAALRRPPPARRRRPPRRPAICLRRFRARLRRARAAAAPSRQSRDLRLRAHQRRDSARLGPQRGRGRQTLGPTAPHDEEAEAPRRVDSHCRTRWWAAEPMP